MEAKIWSCGAGDADPLDDDPDQRDGRVAAYRALAIAAAIEELAGASIEL